MMLDGLVCAGSINLLCLAVYSCAALPASAPDLALASQVSVTAGELLNSQEEWPSNNRLAVYTARYSTVGTEQPSKLR